MVSAIKITRPWLALLKTAITDLPDFSWWKVLIYSCGCCLYMFWIQKKKNTKWSLFDAALLAEMIKQSCYVHFKRRWRTKHIAASNFRAYCAWTLKNATFSEKHSVSNIFIKTFQIDTKASNHEQIISTV